MLHKETVAQQAIATSNCTPRCVLNRTPFAPFCLSRSATFKRNPNRKTALFGIQTMQHRTGRSRFSSLNSRTGSMSCCFARDMIFSMFFYTLAFFQYNPVCKRSPHQTPHPNIIEEKQHFPCFANSRCTESQPQSVRKWQHYLCGMQWKFQLKTASSGSLPTVLQQRFESWNTKLRPLNLMKGVPGLQ